MSRWVIALLLVSVTRPALAGEVTSSGRHVIRAPDGLVLGRDATATVHVRAGAGLRLVTSAGTISDLVADGPESRATLTLPAERFPQLAIVAVVAGDGTVRDWLAIPLAGQARVKIETDRLASVVVRVGGAEFGPVQADGRGVAQIEIVVPPGTTRATTVATGTDGAIREKTMPLGGRPFSRVLAVCGPHGDRVSVVATLATGAPATTAPRMTSSIGTLTAASSIAPGVFVAAYTGDRADVAVLFPGEESVVATCTLTVPPEPPHAIRVTADRTAFVAGSGVVRLAIEADYRGARRPLELSTPAIEADAGSVGTPQRTATGWTAVWTLPDAFAGKRTARAAVRAIVPGGELRAELALRLVGAAATRIDASAPARLRADGSSEGTVVARVVDRWDNLVASPNLAARARGHLGVFTARSDGAATASYVAPHAREPGDDIVELSDPGSGLTAHATIRLDALPRRFGFSARLGYLSNLGRVSTPIAAVSAAMRLPVLAERLVLGIEVAGYSTAFDAQEMGLAETVSARITAVPVLARLAYRAPLGPIDAWIGGGAGVAFASSRLSSTSSGTQTSSATRFAATGFAGAALRTGPGWIVVEGAYLHATLPDAPIAGRIGGIVATAGFAVDL
jgi:hypothetical protein